MLTSIHHLKQLSRVFRTNTAVNKAACCYFSTSNSKHANSFLYRENFATRHNGIGDKCQQEMLKTINIGVKSDHHNLVII